MTFDLFPVRALELRYDLDFNAATRTKFKGQSTKFKNLKTKDQSPVFEMTPKEIAAHYEAKVFESPEAAKVAGFVLGDTEAPRNVWNKASAAQAIVLKLVEQRERGVAKDIGLIIEPWSVTGCYIPAGLRPAAA